jgi:hypothetical protein
VVERRAADPRRLPAHAPGGRHHPGHRRRQQQPQHGHLLRRRHGLGLPERRHRERRPGRYDPARHLAPGGLRAAGGPAVTWAA